MQLKPTDQPNSAFQFTLKRTTQQRATRPTPTLTNYVAKLMPTINNRKARPFSHNRELGVNAGYSFRAAMLPAWLAASRIPNILDWRRSTSRRHSSSALFCLAFRTLKRRLLRHLKIASETGDRPQRSKRRIGIAERWLNGRNVPAGIIADYSHPVDLNPRNRLTSFSAAQRQ
jgi:hypothetical protein